MKARIGWTSDIDSKLILPEAIHKSNILFENIGPTFFAILEFCIPLGVKMLPFLVWIICTYEWAMGFIS